MVKLQINYIKLEKAKKLLVYTGKKTFRYKIDYIRFEIV